MGPIFKATDFSDQDDPQLRVRAEQEHPDLTPRPPFFEMVKDGGSPGSEWFGDTNLRAMIGNAVPVEVCGALLMFMLSIFEEVPVTKCCQVCNMDKKMCEFYPEQSTCKQCLWYRGHKRHFAHMRS